MNSKTGGKTSPVGLRKQHIMLLMESLTTETTRVRTGQAEREPNFDLQKLYSNENKTKLYSLSCFDSFRQYWVGLTWVRFLIKNVSNTIRMQIRYLYVIGYDSDLYLLLVVRKPRVLKMSRADSTQPKRPTIGVPQGSSFVTDRRAHEPDSIGVCKIWKQKRVNPAKQHDSPAQGFDSECI